MLKYLINLFLCQYLFPLFFQDISRLAKIFFANETQLIFLLRMLVELF